eukprot:COSAG02_NODE_682_length_18523_cov_28.592271_11_plen_67_part_00
MSSITMGQMRSWKMMLSKLLSNANACGRWLAMLTASDGYLLQYEFKALSTSFHGKANQMPMKTWWS